MAKGRRDVELVVRARNEASKAVDAVTTSLEALTKTQKAASDSAGKTQPTLSQLGTELGKLGSKIGGASVFDKLASSAARAAESVNQLGSRASEAAQDQSRLAAQVAKTEAEYATLSKAVATANANLQKAKTDTASAAKAQADYNAELRKAKAEHMAAADAHEKDLAKLREQQKLVQSLSRQGPSNELSRQQDRLSSLQDNEFASRITKTLAAGNVKGLEDQYLGLEMALGRVASAEKRAEGELSDLTSKMGVASANLGSLRTAEAAAANDADRLAQQLSEANTELSKVQTSTMSADAAMAKVGGTVRQTLLTALKEGTAQLQSYRDAWLQAQSAAANASRNSRSAYASGNNAAGAASEAEMRAAVQAAGQAKQAYIQQQQALQTLRTAIRAAGTDVQALNELFNGDTAAANRFRTALQTLQTTVTTSSSTQRQVATAARDTANAMGDAANEAGAYEQSLSRLGSSGRQTLSMWQRIRGEVIALTLSYVGLYGAMDQLRGVVSTYNQLQAAQVKLGVAFGSNEQAIKEFAWLREEADRLGLSYIDLTNEYSKFAIAINQSPQLAGKARELFTPFAEAGRVLNLTTDDISGVLVAVTQMASKGTVSMEELRQQLGDRLVGAFEQMAKAMNMSGGELSKLIASGNLASSTALPRLAAQLHETFGPGVAKSAQTLSAEMARFQNSVVDMQSAFANGGFADALSESLRDLNTYFQSDDGKKFFEQLGAAAGVAVKVLALIPKNIDLIAIALAAMVGVKASSFISDLNLRFKDYMAASGIAARTTAATTVAMNANAAGAGSLRTVLIALRTSMTGVQTSSAAAGVSLTGTTGKFTLMRAAVVATSGAVGVLRTALAALGGPVGLAITAVTIALGYWATETDKATEALDRHDGVLDKVRKQYQDAKGDVKAWSDQVRKASLEELGADKNRLSNALEANRADTTTKFTTAVSMTAANFSGGAEITKLNSDILTAAKNYHEAKISAADFVKELNRIAAANPKMVGMVDKWLPGAQEAANLETKLKQVEAAMRVVTGAATDADKEMAGFADAAEGKAAPAVSGLDEALTNAKEKFGATTEEAQKMKKELDEIDQFQKMTDLIPGIDKTSAKYKELLAVLQRARQEIERKYSTESLKGVMDVLSPTMGAGQLDMSAALLRNFEGFSSSAYWDVNAYRAGYGSDTTTLADGSIQKITKGMQVSVEDANRDLVRRIGDFQKVVQGQVGASTFQAMSPQQQAALTSVAYNYGSLPKDIAAAVKTGSADGVAAAIRGHSGDNGGVNAGRRQTEAAIFSHQGGFTSSEDAEKQLKAAKDYREELIASNAEKAKAAQLSAQEKIDNATAKADFTVMTEQQKELAIEKQQELAIQEATNDAKKKGTELDAEMVASIKARVRAQYEEAHALDEINAKTREREAAEKLINSLQSQRQSLTEQIKLAEDSGNSGAVEALKAQLAEVNAQLQTAIQNIITMWQKAGKSAEADAALQQYQLLGQQIAAASRTGREFLMTGEDINKSIATGLGSTAVDNFISKIQEGQDVWSALGDTMRQFFADFLLQIGKAILQQAILNALTGAMGGGGSVGGVISGWVGKLFHSGGVASQTSNRSRSVSPAWFANAARYHGGGVAGLNPGEVPAILEEGERIRTADQEKALQERLRNAESGSGATPVNVKVNNLIDSGSFVSEGLNTAVGERAIMNFMTTRKGAVRRALGI